MNLFPIKSRFRDIVVLSFVTLGLVATGARAMAQTSLQDTYSKVVESKSQEKKDIAAMEKQGWHLTFHDEFDGSKLDKFKWIDSYPDKARTHNNGEHEYYAEDGYDLTGGKLRLIGQKRSIGGMPYTSGMVTSYGKFSQLYGLFEIRTRVPAGKGMWPAFWLLPDTKAWPPEIDILEILGHEPDKVYLTNHYSNADGKPEGKGDSFKGPDFSAAFHTYSVEWKTDAIIWYVDGVERYRTAENIPSVPMYILANLAIGGDWPGNPDDATIFPAYMEIDYIRAYSRSADAKVTRAH